MADSDYTALPALKGSLESARAEGRPEDIARIQKQIDELTLQARKHARAILAERNRLKNGFAAVSGRIKALREDGADASSAELKGLLERARDLKTRHAAANNEIARIKRALTQVSSGPSTSESPVSSVLPDTESGGGDGGEDASLTEPRRGLVITLIIAAAAIVIVGGGGFAALSILNNRLADTVEVQVEDLIESAGLDEVLAYDDLRVQSLAGRVSLDGVTISDEVSGTSATIDSIGVRVPPLEALRARAALAGGGDAIANVEFSSVTASLAGLVADVQETGKVRLERASLTVAGRLAASTLDAPPQEQLVAIERIELDVAGAAIEPGIDPFELSGFEWLGDINELFALDSLHLLLEHDAEAGEVLLRDYSIAAPLYEQNATGRLLYELSEWNEPYPVAIAADLSTLLLGRERAMRLSDPWSDETLFVADLPGISFSFGGSIAFLDEYQTPDLSELNARTSLEVSAFQVQLAPPMLEDLAWDFPFIMQLAPNGELGLQRLALEIDAESPSNIRLVELALDSPIAVFAVSGALGMDPVQMAPTSLDLDGTVESIPDELRAMLIGFAEMMEVRVPEGGPFTFSAALSADGAMDILVQEGL